MLFVRSFPAKILPAANNPVGEVLELPAADVFAGDAEVDAAAEDPRAVSSERLDIEAEAGAGTADLAANADRGMPSPFTRTCSTSCFSNDSNCSRLGFSSVPVVSVKSEDKNQPSVSQLVARRVPIYLSAKSHEHRSET